MSFSLEINPLEAPIDAAFMDRLKQIYAAMDLAYTRAADHYGFSCDGCPDSCCRSLFYHHTIIEYGYLVEGLKTLDRGKLKEVKDRALHAVVETAEAGRIGTAVRIMCPLNFDELCILYPYRPMICRLHGIPHELQKPGQNPVYRTGCDTFSHRCDAKGYIQFDRTPFYRDMALLEQEVRQAMGTNKKIRMTVAEMILSYADGMGHRARGNDNI